MAANKLPNGQRFLPIGSNPQTDMIAIRDKYRDGAPVHILSHNRQLLDTRATFALACIERWGMIAGKDGGEDTAGRAKVDLMPVGEMVERACNSAQEAFDQFQQRGWITELPSYQDLVDQTKDNENAND